MHPSRPGVVCISARVELCAPKHTCDCIATRVECCASQHVFRCMLPTQWICVCIPAPVELHAFFVAAASQSPFSMGFHAYHLLRLGCMNGSTCGVPCIPTCFLCSDLHFSVRRRKHASLASPHRFEAPRPTRRTSRRGPPTTNANNLRHNRMHLSVPHTDPLRGPAPPVLGQGCIRRERASEAAPGAGLQAVGGGCRSGWGRLLSVTNAIEAGICRQGDSGWALAGCLGGEGDLQCIPAQDAEPPNPSQGASGQQLPSLPASGVHGRRPPPPVTTKTPSPTPLLSRPRRTPLALPAIQGGLRPTGIRQGVRVQTDPPPRPA